MSFWLLPAPLRGTVFQPRPPEPHPRGAYPSSPPPLILSPDLAPTLTLPEVLFLSFQASSLYLLPSPSLHPPLSYSWVHKCMGGVHGWVGVCMGTCKGGRVCMGGQVHQSTLLDSTSLPVAAPSWVAQHLKINILLTHFQLSLQLASPCTQDSIILTQFP